MNIFEKPIKVVSKVATKISDKSPVILTGCAVAGVVTTVIFAVKATPKAEILLKEHKNETKEDKIDIVVGLGKIYAPTIISGAATIGCIIGANQINSTRQLALATAYNLANKDYKEYREKAKELLGDKKDTEIKDAVSSDHVLRTYGPDIGIIETGHGTALCYDENCGRYFHSSPEYIRRVLMNAYASVLVDMWISHDDIYFDLGLPSSRYSEIMGVGVDDAKELIDFEGGGIFSSMLTDNNTPVLCVKLPCSKSYMDMRDY